MTDHVPPANGQPAATDIDSSHMVPLGGRAALAAAAARLNQAHAVSAERFPALRQARDFHASQAVDQRADSLHLDDRDYRFLVGWMTGSSPAAMNDALDGMIVWRDTRDER